MPFLPTTTGEMRSRGWDQCDVILVTGDAYMESDKIVDNNEHRKATW
ncbi:MAG: hypothetical protein QME74_07880, partial [Candidatus Edwardsbacteria bacterium]|nr:hypothetical protein [Candidatus Edwardsbacteria bacterium]